MSDASDRAANLEQQYVGEYDDEESLVEGLDPDLDDEDQTTAQVKAAAPDSQTEREVDEMARDDR